MPSGRASPENTLFGGCCGAGWGGNYEVVFLLPSGGSGVGIGDANHRGSKILSVFDESHVVVIGKPGILIKIRGATHYRARLGASAS
jgi:hypothetical protein